MSSNKLSLLFRLRPSNFLNARKIIHSFQPYRPIITFGQTFFSYDETIQPIPKHNLITKRFKKTVKRKLGDDSTKNKDDDDDDDDDDELAGENPMLMDDLLGPSSDGSKRVVIDVGTLRLDGFSKTAFGVTRAKIEEAFYKGDLYVNGERPQKKSADLYKGDEIDFIRGYDEEDKNLLKIRRVQIVELPDKASEQGRMKVTIDRYDDLTVKAYDKRDG